ncbi:MAG: hypothetical protein Q8L60_13220 [Gammaproteobacteria bacterium]|nr:hypothetical protein [Gammaproteobacteria bacterium]MDP2348305.1 hypothetical protein [Gammaproteobacteria bacterium]
MPTQKQTFWEFFWSIAKSPLAYLHANPLMQSACASGINMWCLFLAVLAQFWVFLSFFILLAQTYNTWLVAQGRISSVRALIIGIGIVIVNFAALSLAVLGQFWVFISLGLSIWQYVSLIRVCFSKGAYAPH